MRKVFFGVVMILSLLVISVASFADTEYDAALNDYYRGHFKDAVVRLKAYVERKPDPVAYYLIGYSLYKLRRFREATEYFNEAYLIDPNFSPEQLGLGQNVPIIKAKTSRKKMADHARRRKSHAMDEKQKGRERKGAPSSAAKTGQKGPAEQ